MKPSYTELEKALASRADEIERLRAELTDVLDKVRILLGAKSWDARVAASEALHVRTGLR